MVGPSLSSTHSLTLKPTANIKFLCSYGGRILPRYPDGKLRYHGGETRVLSVKRSVSFAELLLKLAEMCGKSVSLRCQLPTEDLDALVSITSDDDLASLIEEYDRVAPPNSTDSIKIRAFLSPPKITKKSSPLASTATSTAFSSSSSCSSSSSTDGTTPPPLYSTALPPRCPTSSSSRRCIQTASKPPKYVVSNRRSGGKCPQCACNCGRANSGNMYLVHNGCQSH